MQLLDPGAKIKILGCSNLNGSLDATVSENSSLIQTLFCHNFVAGLKILISLMNNNENWPIVFLLVKTFCIVAPHLTSIVQIINRSVQVFSRIIYEFDSAFHFRSSFRYEKRSLTRAEVRNKTASISD